MRRTRAAAATTPRAPRGALFPRLALFSRSGGLLRVGGAPLLELNVDGGGGVAGGEEAAEEEAAKEEAEAEGETEAAAALSGAAALRRGLAAAMRPPGGSCSWWVAFADDDDILHPRRFEAYLAGAAAAPAAARAVSAAWIARPVGREEGVASAAGVDALVAAGRAVRTPRQAARTLPLPLPLTQTPTLTSTHATLGGGRWSRRLVGGVLELCRAARSVGPAVLCVQGSFTPSCPAQVRLDALRPFFARASDGLLRSTYADMALYFYLRNAVPTTRFAPRSGFSSNWLYFYDKCAASYSPLAYARPRAPHSLHRFTPTPLHAYCTPLHTYCTHLHLLAPPAASHSSPAGEGVGREAQGAARRL